MLTAWIVALLIFLALLYAGRGFLAWTVGLAALLIGWRMAGVESAWLWWTLLVAGAGAAALTGRDEWRRRFITPRLMTLMERAMPRIGQTEREALEAGSVWWDAQLFSGKPDWNELLNYRITPLSDREQAFLDGPVETLCRMIDDWQVTQKRDLPEEVWTFVKEKGFFGLVIPEEYGGLGFSAIAQSRVVTRLSSRSIPLAVTVMVPNSLGPGELLLKYGTEEQRDHYLPRLACGEEIPCFGLTGPEAGSDAAATQSTGVVVRRKIGGKSQLGIVLNWQKRYITLAPVATLIGLAFRLKDPDGLLGDTEDLGITCALVPADAKGVSIGRRHDPMGVPFHNGPIEGKDV
ncbi:MAG: acyl-CoA dehydrogenase family protein, partial [Xanthomonadales bacterium]|nr:acyl-CoA dehydrogenase family protein [Xanthomonadales bacterium]